MATDLGYSKLNAADNLFFKENRDFGKIYYNEKRRSHN